MSKRGLTPEDGGKARENPARGMGGQERRVLDKGAGVRPSGDDPVAYPLLSSAPSQVTDSGAPPPVPDADAPLSHYKGLALKNIGRNPKTGQIIPHQYSTKVARQVATWIAGGYSANDICIRLNMRPGKLKELYGREIATGLEQIGMEVTEHILSRVKKSDRMAIFFAKARMGWRDGEVGDQGTGVMNIHIHA